MNIIEIAEKIATEAHLWQFRRGGEPYINHPFRVMRKVREQWYPQNYQVVALEHDILEENKSWNLQKLESELSKADNTMPYDIPSILIAVDAITKLDDEPYYEYLQKVKMSEIARIVKIYDIEDNLADAPKPEKIDIYRLALYYLKY